MYQKIENKIMWLGDKLSNNIILMILRDAFMLVFPLTIFGSVMLVIANFPYLDSIIGVDAVNTLRNILGPAATATMSIATIFVSLGIGYYASRYKKVEPLFGAAIALVAFFLLTPFDMTTASGEVVTNVLSIERLGAKGMFIGIFASFGAAFLYAAIVKKNWIIKMPPSVPPAVAKSFAALLPALITLTLFLMVLCQFSGRKKFA